jgi:hypothetical protein
MYNTLSITCAGITTNNNSIKLFKTGTGTGTGTATGTNIIIIPNIIRAPNDT